MILTVWILLAVVTFLIVYDVYAVSHGGFKDTISWVIYSNSQKYPIIPFGIGVLCGHLFWSQVC